MGSVEAPDDDGARKVMMRSGQSESMPARRRGGLIWAAATLILGVVTSYGGGTETERRPLTVGVTAQEPVVVVSQNGLDAGGIAPEILEGVAAEKGWQVRYVPGSMQECVRGLEQGTLDLVMPMPWPGSQVSRVDVGRVGILCSWGRLYVSKMSSIQTLGELSGATIAVVAGDVHYGKLRDMMAEAGVRSGIVEMRHYGQVLEALNRRQVDAGLVDVLYGERRLNGYEVKASSIATPAVEFRFAAPRSGNRAVLDVLDEALRAQHADQRSSYYRSLERWGGSSRWYVRLAWAVGITLLAGTGGVWLLMLRQRRYAAAARRMEQLEARNAMLARHLEEGEQRERTVFVWREWYRSLFNHSHDAILVYGLDERDQAGKFVEANDTSCALLGYTRQELLELTPKAIEAGVDGERPPHVVLREQQSSGRVPAEMVVERVYRTKTGSEVPVEATIRLLSLEGRTVVMCAAHDITKRQTALTALRESERQFQDFFTRSPIGIAIYDAEQAVKDVNHAALAMFGLSERSQFAKIDLFHAARFSEEYRQELLKGGTIRFEWEFNCDEERQRSRLPLTRSGCCWFDVFATNLGLDAAFNAKGFLVQIQDVTDRRRVEEALRKNERALRQSQKMEAIGSLAGGIAHDFNNILTPILGYTEMALLSTPQGANVRAHLDEIRKASHRAKGLVKQILAFSRQSGNEALPVRMGAIVNEVRMLLKGSTPPNVELRCSTRLERDIVLADPTQIHQVIMNLCSNAFYAMREKGGVLELSLKSVLVGSNVREALSRLNPGAYVDLIIRDTGCGMDKKTMDRIFEPFFTTKKPGEGTGMGLAVAHGIVSGLNGTIYVESEVGKGSVFHVVLPLAIQETEQVAEQAEPPPSGSGTVLFVDDEGDIVAMAEQMLSSLGYTAVVCRGSHEALRVFQQDAQRFNLVITDQMMPGMTGIEMVKEMRRTRRDLPVIMCTGFSRSISEQELAECQISEVVMKPIVLRQLAEAMRRALGQEAAPGREVAMPASKP